MVIASGLTPLKPVSARDVKFDKATRTLEKLKVRHAWNQPLATKMAVKKGEIDREFTASTTADSLLINAQLGHSAATGRSVTNNSICS